MGTCRSTERPMRPPSRQDWTDAVKTAADSADLPREIASLVDQYSQPGLDDYLEWLRPSLKDIPESTRYEMPTEKYTVQEFRTYSFGWITSPTLYLDASAQRDRRQITNDGDYFHQFANQLFNHRSCVAPSADLTAEAKELLNRMTALVHFVNDKGDADSADARPITVWRLNGNHKIATTLPFAYDHTSWKFCKQTWIVQQLSSPSLYLLLEFSYHDESFQRPGYGPLPKSTTGRHR